MARDVAGLRTGLRLLLDTDRLEVPPADLAIGRVRGLPDVDSEIDGAIDRLLAESEYRVVDVTLPGWDAAFAAHRVVLGAEAWDSDGSLLAGTHQAGVGDEARAKLLRGSAITSAELASARAAGDAWREEIGLVLGRVPVLALPTIPCLPPLLGSDWGRLVWLTAPINLALLPAVSLPVPRRGGLPASLQLVGAEGSEELLLAVAELMEAAALSGG